uniref:Uncharacterized protein n=1 Tax=Oryza rufipogon TaxID=4529 RepID=A0A0E0RIG3_ORYRU
MAVGSERLGEEAARRQLGEARKARGGCSATRDGADDEGRRQINPPSPICPEGDGWRPAASLPSFLSDPPGGERPPAAAAWPSPLQQ